MKTNENKVTSKNSSTLFFFPTVQLQVLKNKKNFIFKLTNKKF